jgi:hypothetical protein
VRLAGASRGSASVHEMGLPVEPIDSVLVEGLQRARATMRPEGHRMRERDSPVRTGNPLPQWCTMTLSPIREAK